MVNKKEEPVKKEDVITNVQNKEKKPAIITLKNKEKMHSIAKKVFLFLDEFSGNIKERTGFGNKEFKHFFIRFYYTLKFNKNKKKYL